MRGDRSGRRCGRHPMRLLGDQGKVASRRFNQALPMGHLMAGPGAALPQQRILTHGRKGHVHFLCPGPTGSPRSGPMSLCWWTMPGRQTATSPMRRRTFSWPRSPANLIAQAALRIEEAIASGFGPGKKSRDIWDLSQAEGLKPGHPGFLGGHGRRAKPVFVGHGVGYR